MAKLTRPGSSPTGGDQPLYTTAIRTEPGVYGYDAWRNVTIGVWVGQATLAAVRGLFEISALMERKHPEGRSSVVFVLDQVAAPLPEAQAEMTRIYDSPGLACTALVVEGSGFWASGIRSMSTNLHRVGTGSVRMRVHTVLDEILTWFPAEHLERTGVQLEADAFKRVLTSVRRDAEARARGAV